MATISHASKTGVRQASLLSGHVAVFLLGMALTVGFYWALWEYAPAGSLLLRYCAGHPVEYAETGLFAWALVALVAKSWNVWRQRAALQRQLLPAWSGNPVPVEEAERLLFQLDQLPRPLQRSLVAQRYRGALDFVASRKSSAGLDDQLRHLADADADAVEGSYSLVRFITWAIPILGFLGTVLGITDAIANVTPEQLAKSITGVTDGLAIAFDTTAIALVFSMILMFLSFAVDRGDQRVLRGIDEIVQRQLAHRFEREGGTDRDGAAEFLHRGSQQLVQLHETLLQRQAAHWTAAMEDMTRRLDQAERTRHEDLCLALRLMLDATLESHQQRLLALEAEMREETGQLTPRFEDISRALREVSHALHGYGQHAAEQTGLLGKLLDSEHQILRLQESLNLTQQTLAQSNTFEQAMHALTAAIHLLTARAESASASNRALRLQHGNAA